MVQRVKGEEGGRERGQRMERACRAKERNTDGELRKVMVYY